MRLCLVKAVQAEAENEESEEGAESETDDDEERDEADDEDKYDERDEEDYDDYPQVIRPMLISYTAYTLSDMAWQFNDLRLGDCWLYSRLNDSGQVLHTSSSLKQCFTLHYIVVVVICIRSHNWSARQRHHRLLCRV